MKRRWKVALGAAAALATLVLVPLSYIELGCRDPLPGGARGSYRPLLPAVDHRPEARTWLTYPEWHIVYSADSPAST